MIIDHIINYKVYYDGRLLPVGELFDCNGKLVLLSLPDESKKKKDTYEKPGDPPYASLGGWDNALLKELSKFSQYFPLELHIQFPSDRRANVYRMITLEQILKRKVIWVAGRYRIFPATTESSDFLPFNYAVPRHLPKLDWGLK